jgi:hypothetical protein
MSRSSRLAIVLSIALGALTAGCAGTPAVRSQAYAPLRSERDFEYELRPVWDAIEGALRNQKIQRRDPDEVQELEWKSLKERKLETDWIYSQSREKYQEYRVNDLPQKKYLQIRFRYAVVALRVMGGTHVAVRVEEEVEKLHTDGSSDGYSGMAADPSRAT